MGNGRVKERDGKGGRMKGKLRHHRQGYNYRNRYGSDFPRGPVDKVILVWAVMAKGLPFRPWVLLPAASE